MALYEPLFARPAVGVIVSCRCIMQDGHSVLKNAMPGDMGDVVGHRERGFNIRWQRTGRVDHFHDCETYMLYRVV